MATTPAPSCPRCGYDQSGVIGTWKQIEPPACPLEGLCSECGLRFLWRDALCPHWNRVPWLFEHGRGLAPIRATRTWSHALTPARFWRGVPLAAEVRPKRLLLWLVVLFVPLQVVLGGAEVARRFDMYGPFPWRTYPGREWDIALDLVSAAAAPWLDLYRLLAIRGPATAFGWARPSFPYAVAAGLAMSALIPFELLILSSSRDDAKVRRAHVARAAVYGLAWLVPVLVLLATIGWTEQLGLDAANLRGICGFGYGPPVALIAITVWLGLWWRAAIIDGFQFARAGIVWALLMVGAILLGLIFAALNQDLVYWMMRIR